jgi:hypothetical protein
VFRTLVTLKDSVNCPVVGPSCIPVREPIMTTPAIWEREMMDVAAREAAPFISRRSAAMIV